MITNKGGIYGTGHFNRMRLLKNHLEKMNITCEIVSGKSMATGIGSRKVVLLDSRDDEFPGEVMTQKKDDHYFIAIDNRGEGRRQCDLVWDTLPHMNMTENELKTALKNCILDPNIYERLARPAKSKIIRTTLENIEAEKNKIDLIQYAEKDREKMNEPTNETQFHEKLIHSKKIATYFGQTFFEALYLGKEIYLYDISDYHKQLSDWFTGRWNRQPDLNEIFDGQGLHRLAVLIRSILLGVLYV
jgi:hypothetical protein